MVDLKTLWVDVGRPFWLAGREGAPLNIAQAFYEKSLVKLEQIATKSIFAVFLLLNLSSITYKTSQGIRERETCENHWIIVVNLEAISTQHTGPIEQLYR